MNLREFYDEVEQLLPGGFSVEVEVWNHRHEDHAVTVEWSIWSVDLKTHYNGPTPEVALELLRAARTASLLRGSDIPPLTTAELLVCQPAAESGDDIPF